MTLQKKDDFFEILTKSDKGYTLLKLTKAKFLKADNTDIMRVKDGDNYDEFIDDITYYISYNSGVPQQVTFKEKSIEKALMPEQDKVTAYFKQNTGTLNESYLTLLIQSLNNN